MGAVGKGGIDYECEKIIGFWELKKKIGSGGNGKVWECIDQVGNAFAMKILTKTTGEAYQRFLDEVKVMLSHLGTVASN